MIPPSVIAFGAKYGLIILGVLMIGGYLAYLHHSIYQEGYDDAKAKYEFRDAKATAEALGILSESKRKNDVIHEKDKLYYANRIENLTNELAIAANDNTSSMPVRTQGSQACGTGKTHNIEGNGSGVVETGVAELAAYNRRLLIQTGARINAMAKELLVCADKVSEAYNLE